uniref:Chalcone/stilbene synthase family protein n=1 Tax=Chondromyces catenulatus TaxID=1653841 RepID=A0A3S5GY10_9BACT|nr:chalcone/stilbene synthase family protein [Chondromyces catenulatus]
MATIENTWTHFPGQTYKQEELAEHLPHWVKGDKLGLAQQLFRRSGVASRNLIAAPADLVKLGRSFAAKNDRYRVEVRAICHALAKRILEQTTEEERRSIDLLVTASCTGFQIPAMDVVLIEELKLSPTIRRLNLTQHGCAAGAAGVGLSHEWLSTRAESRALVVCVELCSLTFQMEDATEENLVSAAIFGDGAAAVLLAGENAARPAEGRSVSVKDTYREIFSGTEHFMGFDVNEAGLKIKLSRDVVSFTRREIEGVLVRACDRWGVPGLASLTIGAVHPGGRRILEILEDDVGLPTSVTRTSWECLKQHGNLSSVTVLITLDRLLADKQSVPSGSRGLLSAFGPGFCAELGLLEVA